MPKADPLKPPGLNRAMYAKDDPMRYLHVPRRERSDVDGPESVAGANPEDGELIAQARDDDEIYEGDLG